MGYNPEHLRELARLVEAGEFDLPLSVFDLGAQDLHFHDPSEAANAVNVLADTLGVRRPAGHLIPNEAGIVPVERVMDALLVRYACTDIEVRPNVLVLDLNSNDVPDDLDAMRGSFELVTNFGNTEHIANQLYSFRLMHDLVKPGGLMWFHVPMMGFLNHGYVNLTPKFWQGLISHNRYSIVHSHVENKGDDRINPNYYSESFSVFGDFPQFESVMLNLIVRKNDEELFIPPLDFSWRGLTVERFRGVYRPAIARLYPNVSDDAIEQALSRLVRARQGSLVQSDAADPGISTAIVAS